MAHAVIGGVIASTLLTLLIVPVVFTYLDDLGARLRRLFGAAAAPLDARKDPA
jgi:HAE1 family hydrophobic/amphiphilic exporter-1